MRLAAYLHSVAQPARACHLQLPYRDQARRTTQLMEDTRNAVPYHNDGYRYQGVYLQVRCLTGRRVRRMVPSEKPCIIAGEISGFCMVQAALIIRMQQ